MLARVDNSSLKWVVEGSLMVKFLLNKLICLPKILNIINILLYTFTFL